MINHFFTHTSIAVKDPDSMLAFYRDLLGLEVMADFDTDEEEPSRKQFFKDTHAMPDGHFRMVRLRGPQPPFPAFALELKKWYPPTPRPSSIGSASVISAFTSLLSRLRTWTWSTKKFGKSE
jgi:catechol 2,3-dioxygenase-like lactoylglutathione lyase family enzyme